MRAWSADTCRVSISLPELSSFLQPFLAFSASAAFSEPSSAAMKLNLPSEDTLLTMSAVGSAALAAQVSRARARACELCAHVHQGGGARATPRARACELRAASLCAMSALSRRASRVLAGSLRMLSACARTSHRTLPC